MQICKSQRKKVLVQILPLNSEHTRIRKQIMMCLYVSWDTKEIGLKYESSCMIEKQNVTFGSILTPMFRHAVLPRLGRMQRVYVTLDLEHLWFGCIHTKINVRRKTYHRIRNLTRGAGSRHKNRVCDTFSKSTSSNPPALEVTSSVQLKMSTLRGSFCVWTAQSVTF